MSRAVVCLVAVLNLAWPRPACPEPGRGAQPPSQPARDTPTAATGGSAVIRGRILEATTGRPLSRVTVRANGNGPQPPGGANAAVTGADGRYEIKGLAAGTYMIAATKPNYVRTAWGEQRAEGPGKRIPLTDGQVLEKIDLRLVKAGVITGRVVDEFGDPVTNAQVVPMRYQFIQGSRRLMQAGRGAQTNDIGEYRMFGLSPGQYYVSAVLRNFSMGGPQESTDRSGYAATYYPGTGNVAEAQRLTIAPAQTITSINLTLLPIQTARVTGVVLDTMGRPMGGVQLNAMQRMGPGGFMASGGRTLDNGTFTINGLTPGEYTISANAPGSPEQASQLVTIDGSDISGLQLMLTKPSTIRGRIAFTASATAAEPPKPTAFDLGAVRDWAIAQQVRSQARIKDDGTFEITLQPGRVLIRGAMSAPPQATGPGAPAPWRLSRVIVNDLDVGDSGIDVPPNGVIENVVVEMTNRSNEASGSVTDADGKVVRDCYVIVFAQDPTRWTVQTRYMSIARPGLDDRYHVRLLAGDYYAVAMSDVEVNAWTDPEFLSLARERATKFSIADGEAKTIDLALSPAPVF